MAVYGLARRGDIEPLVEDTPQPFSTTPCPDCGQLLQFGSSHAGTCRYSAMHGGPGSDLSMYADPVCSHDWRLIDAKRANFATYLSEDGKRVKRPVPVVYRWYCTRCRVIEETTA